MLEYILLVYWNHHVCLWVQILFKVGMVVCHQEPKCHAKWICILSCKVTNLVLWQRSWQRKEGCNMIMDILHVFGEHQCWGFAGLPLLVAPSLGALCSPFKYCSVMSWPILLSDVMANCIMITSVKFGVFHWTWSVFKRSQGVWKNKDGDTFQLPEHLLLLLFSEMYLLLLLFLLRL